MLGILNLMVCVFGNIFRHKDIGFATFDQVLFTEHVDGFGGNGHSITLPWSAAIPSERGKDGGGCAQKIHMMSEKEILIVRIYLIIHSSMVLVSVENFTPTLTTLRPSVRYGLA